MKDETVIEVQHLRKSFGEKKVLKDVSLDIKRAENLVVMGKSGTGKSVLIKCMVRLIEPDRGSVKIFGKEMTKLNEEELNDSRKKIGFLFQSGALYDSMTVRQNLEFPLRDLKKEDRRKLRETVEETLENVGLLDAIDKMPSELSGGMRKRVGLARTLIMKPEIILYDEPSTGLDPITAREISDLIVTVQEKYKATAVIITHDLECAKITANRIVMLHDGLIIAEGSFDELSDSDDDTVRQFFTPATIDNRKKEEHERRSKK